MHLLIIEFFFQITPEGNGIWKYFDGLYGCLSEASSDDRKKMTKFDFVR